MTKIQLKRGLEKDLPILAVGEPAFTIDTWKLFVGSPDGNKQVFGGGGTGIATPNTQSWISTDNQDTFTITNGYISNVKSLIVFVDGIIQPDTTLLTSTTFKLPEPISAGIDVYAMWFEVSSSTGGGSGGGGNYPTSSFMPNSYNWVATDGQDTFKIANGNITDIRLLNVYVGGVIQPNIALLDNQTFQLPETLSAGVNVYAEWFEPLIPLTSDGNGSLANEYEWTATDGQVTYNLPDGKSYDTTSKWFEVYVGGASIPDSQIQKDSSVKFTLLIDSTKIKAGMIIFARWTEPYIPASSSHHATHELGGNDEIDVTNLKNYSTFIQTPINVLIGLNDYSTNYTYTGSGDIATETVIDSSSNVICTTTYNYSGTQLSTVVFTMNGTTVTSTYNYDGSGNLTSVVNVKS